MTTDPEAAAGFYRAVVGWKTEPWGKNAAYTLCVAPAGPVAGIMALPGDARAAGVPPAWLSYVGTPDLDATIAHAAGLGARVLKGAAAIEGAGRYAVLADPYGAAFGIYTPAQSGTQPAAAEGQFVWHELTTSDVESALGFYRALFGWGEMQRMDMGATGPYVVFGSDGTQRGGVYRSPPGADSGSHWLAYTQVASADATTTAAVKAGARVLHGPAEVPSGRITMMLDPQGVAFAVHSARMAAKPAAAARKQPAPKRTAAARSKAAPARRKPAAKKAAKRTAAKRSKPARKVARKVAPKPARKVARKASRKAPRRKSARRHR
jgi:predicted enzyme related to lactoylglutathione lyase